MISLVFFIFFFGALFVLTLTVKKGIMIMYNLIERKNLSMKKKVLIVLAVIALFIPTFLAIGSYFLSGNAEMPGGKITDMTVLDLNGKEYALAASDDSDGIISSLLDLEKSAEKLDALPDPLMGSKYFLVTYKDKSENTVNCKYYFSLDDDAVYYVKDGVAYKASASKADKFLSSKYAVCMYDAAKAPVLTVYGKTVAPVNMTWDYKSVTGEFVSLDGISLSNGTESVSAGSLDLSFDVEPDSLFVTVKKGSEVVFNDAYDKLSSLSLEGSEVNVELDAKWFEDKGRDYKGEAKYSFSASLTGPAAFFLVENEIDPGEFVVLTGKNVSDISKISFSSEPSIDFEPVFFRDGDYVRALIPIKVELENKSYVFTVKYGGALSQELSLTIKDKTFKKQTFETTQALINTTRSEAALAAFKSALSPVAKSELDERLWDGTFSTGVRKDAMITTGFGLHITLKATGEEFRHDGVDYWMSAGSAVTAVNRGKVIYAGVTDYTGRLVVIDHGFGLKSWYANLSETKVAVGDIVEKDAEIGIIGNSGFTSGRVNPVAHIGLSVFDVPVCPYSLWDNGIKMYNE